MSKFMELLNLILSYGPRLPAIMEKIEHIVFEVQELISLLTPGVFASMAPVALTEEEADLEAKILSACPAKAAGNFAGPFATIFAFLKANPQIVAFLLRLLAKKP